MHPQGEVARATKLGWRLVGVPWDDFPSPPLPPPPPPLRTHFRDRRRELRYTERAPKADDEEEAPLITGASAPEESSSSSSSLPPSLLLLLPESSEEKVLAFALGTAALLLQTLIACLVKVVGEKGGVRR